MKDYVKKCICCEKLLEEGCGSLNYCDGCAKMNKFNSNTGKLSDILFAIAMIACAIAIISWASNGEKFKDLEKRVNVLEQNASNPK